MIKLLKLEYYKNLNYMPFKVFTIMYFAILIAFLFIGLIDFNLSEILRINLKEQGAYNFPEIWHFTTYCVALLKIFLGLILVFSISQEFSNRMFKQNTIDGLSRQQFLASKLLTILVFTLLSTIVLFIITMFLGYTYSNTTDSKLITKEIFFLGHYFLKLFTFFCFMLFLSVLLRKSIFVLLFLFLYWAFESGITIIEKLIFFANVSEKQNFEAMKNNFFISKLYPLESISNLIPSPFFRLQTMKMFGKYEFHYPTESVIACIVWCVIFISGSYLILKKRDW